MVPYKDGKANRGHSCVKGRFAWGYANHRERILKPMIREKIDRAVARSELGRGDRPRRVRVQAHPGQARPAGDRRHHLLALHQRGDLPRPEADPRRLRQQQRRYLRPRLPFADRLRPRARPSAPRPARRISTRSRTADVILVIGANPTDAHPVFASRMKKRLRAGAKLIVDRSAPHRPGALAACRGRLSPAAAARHQCRDAERAGARHRHRGPDQRGLRARALRPRRLRELGRLRRPSREQPGGGRPDGRRRADAIRGAARLYATGGNGAIYYGLGVTEHSQGTTAVMAIANLAMVTGNIGRQGVGVNPLRGQNNVQGACDMGSFPHELTGYRHISDDAMRGIFEELWGVQARRRARPAHPQHVRRGDRGHLQGHLRAGRGHPAVRSQHRPCRARRSRRWNASSCRTCS